MLKALRSFIAILTSLCVGIVIFLWIEKTFSDDFNACIRQQIDSQTSENSGETSKKDTGASVTAVVTNLRCTGDFIERHNGSITALASLLIAAFTGTLWWAAAGQYDLLERQIKDSRILRRAYLRVAPGGIRPYISSDERLSCDVIFENAGNLPASNISWSIRREFSKDAKFNPPSVENESFVGNNILPPKSEMRKGAKWIAMSDFIGFKKGGTQDDRWLYVWGRVRYSDGFRPTRWIDFCHRYNMLGERGLIIPAENGRYHEFGNRTDEA
jgi:nitrogen fixation-related uncharacterized protein